MSSMNIQFSAAPQSTGNTQGSAGPHSQSGPDKADADMFQKAMQEGGARHDLESGGIRKEAGGWAADASSPQEGGTDSLSCMFSAMSSMSSPLDSIFSERLTGAAPSSQAMDTEALEKLVDRILVSTPADGGHEVRITLGDSTLRGTEILIQRGTDGMLSVVLNTTDASSFQTLVSARSDLQQALERHEGADVRVTVDNGSGGEANDADKRSRGWLGDEYPDL